MNIRVAALQFQPRLYGLDYNRALMARLCSELLELYPDVRLIVMPELCTTGLECAEQFQNLAETVHDSETIQLMSSICRENRVHIIFGFPEKDPQNEILYNAAAMIADSGQLLGTYRKVHLYGEEKKWFQPGNGFPIFSTTLGKIGILICWDCAFAEPARVYALQGADILAVPTSYDKPYEDDWDLMTSARAFDNTLFLIGANRIGHDVKLEYFGHSRIVDPKGRVIAKLDEEVEGYITAEIALDLTQALRQADYPILTDRRPELYKLICDATMPRSW
ncbi:MAG: carbon-nitrogen hydrolase family protein [Coprothermobacterota bacterium]|nr:carbon-nitrogen hydrolase family protein [Coprothermobacterota bacterium]